ncbi:protein of unknown function [Paenibacillaceae bacterium GAS479]|nr:protein of unknown function [Paenibacillaceae bacterium GAS479]
MKRKSNRVLWLLPTAAALFLLLGLLLARPQLPDEPANVSSSADTDGVKAWRELLEKRNGNVGEWRLRWEELPETGSNRLMIAVGPNKIAPKEWEAMESWLRAGNHLLLLDDSGEEPLDWMLFGGKSDDADSEEGAAPAEEKESEAADQNETDSASGKDAPPPEKPIEAEALVGSGSFVAEVSTSLRIQSASNDAETLIKDSEGVLASRLKLGEGSVTFVVEPRWMQNGATLRASHTEIMSALLAGSWSEIMFDEQHHGYTLKPGLFAVYPNWLLLASIMLLLAMLLWLWSSGKRFGPVRIPREWTVRRGDETARALAAWYERFGLMDDALDRQRRRLRQQLSQRWGLSPAATPEQAAAAARSRWSEQDAQRLQHALEERPIVTSGRKAARREFIARSRDTSELAALLRGSSLSGRGERR